MKRKCLIAVIGAMSILLAACGSSGGNDKQDSGGTVENHYFVDGKELSEEEYKEYLDEKEKQKEELNRELTEDEKAAIYTIQQLRDSLKNPHSMKLYSIKYKKGSENSRYILFSVEYSAENNVGGTVEDTLYYQFDNEIYSDNSEKALSARMFGCKEVEFNKYFKSKYEEIEIDVDRVLNNIDIDVLEDTENNIDKEEVHSAVEDTNTEVNYHSSDIEYLETEKN